MHVEAVGKRSDSVPAFWMQNGGSKSLKPRRGGLEQLVTNFKSFLFCSSDNVETTVQKSTKGIKKNNE